MATKYDRLFSPAIQFQTRSGALNTAGHLLVFLDETDDYAEVLDDGMRRITQPVVLDNNGRAPGLFVDSKKIYRLEVYDRNDSLMFTIPHLTPDGGGAGTSVGNYYSGDEYVKIDQEVRTISLDNLKRIVGDEKTIHLIDSDDEVVITVCDDIIGDNTKVKAGPNMSVDYDSDNNEYTVNGNYQGSDTINITSDGVISGKYRGGYGIEVSGNTISKTGHRLLATNNISYAYCKVFDFTWQYIYGRGQCVFTATHYGGDYVTFAVSLTRAIGADYTVAWPYVVSASPYMATNHGFVEKLEIRSIGSRIVGYLKLRNFSQNQMWLDWEGSSNAGIVSFTPQLTNSPEGNIEWTCTVDKNDVFYTQYDADNIFQKKLTAGQNISIDSDNVISSTAGTEKFEAVYGTTTYAQVQSALQAGNIVTLKHEASPEEIRYAQFGGLSVYPDVNEYYFFALGNGGQRTIYTLTSANNWNTFTVNDNDGRVFIAQYNRTSFAEVKGAIDGGKYVVATLNNIYYPLSHNYDARVSFTGKNSFDSSSATFLEVDSDSVWTTFTVTDSRREFTNHFGVQTQDQYAQIGYTRRFNVGEKGSHGGVLDIGMKLGTNGWSGNYKVFTRLYHNSTSPSAPPNGTTEFSTVTISSSTAYTHVGTVPQYMLQTNVQWTYIVEVTYSSAPGCSIRVTFSGLGSTDVTAFAEEVLG